ncbi:enoyl-[acyl-carrier-protein] reductase, mitochondrial [Phlebotomus argentipes]|uniref:enoyl-[acyl-carrier-protein] reductase, mitochondrial n=1 Tax=Phlebotomus argentipes TaxID=94469 RepID=UPI002892B1F3|nr:enoyl-[acyl-carrier-protein] reductase, mitochondrial [Phlebotomus argentipes]
MRSPRMQNNQMTFRRKWRPGEVSSLNQNNEAKNRMICRVFQTARRHMSVLATRLVYSEFGEPAEVVKKVEEKLESPQANEVTVKILAAPINPADINTIQGKYPVKPPLPAIGGNECLAEVTELGANVRNLAVGDRVIPSKTGIGTWCSHANYPCNALFRVPKSLGAVEASTLTVNPTTAYRMLKDFADLKPGDTVLQNGANSAVGQAVFQLCRKWGLKSVGIVRNRPEIDDLRAFLRDLGADWVLTEEEVRTTDLFKSGQVKKPKLALNCVGGKSALEMLRHVADGGVVVTYGGMSREPVTVPTGHLIFKDISFRGFWMTRWTRDNQETPEREKMFRDLVEFIEEGSFRGPRAEIVPVQNYRDALANAMAFQGFIGQKFILDFTQL